MQSSKNQNVLNLVYPVIFIAVLGFVCTYTIIAIRGSLPTSISLFDLSIIVLASFRFIRALTYDKMFRILHTMTRYYPDGTERTYGFVRTLYDLISCPWCTGIYTSVFALFLYFVAPWGWFVLLIFAVSGLASFVQLLSNLIATHYEVADAKLGALKK